MKKTIFIGTQQIQTELNVEIRNEDKAAQIIATTIAKNLHENPECREILKGAKKTKLPVVVYVTSKDENPESETNGETITDATFKFEPKNHALKTFGEVMLQMAQAGYMVEQFRNFFKIKGNEVEGFSVWEKVVNDWTAVKVKLFTIALKETQLENGTTEGKMLISSYNKAMKEQKLLAAPPTQQDAPAVETPAAA